MYAIIWELTQRTVRWLTCSCRTIFLASTSSWDYSPSLVSMLAQFSGVLSPVPLFAESILHLVWNKSKEPSAPLVPHPTSLPKKATMIRHLPLCYSHPADTVFRNHSPLVWLATFETQVGLPSIQVGISMPTSLISPWVSFPINRVSTFEWPSDELQTRVSVTFKKKLSFLLSLN